MTFQSFLLHCTSHIAVLQPHNCRNNYGLGFSPFARHYSGNLYWFLFLRVLRCFSSPRSLKLRLQRNGLPHSDICGSMIICISPQLFAAYHVLRSLWEPRHPPCALICFSLKIAFTLSSTFFCSSLVNELLRSKQPFCRLSTNFF